MKLWYFLSFYKMHTKRCILAFFLLYSSLTLVICDGEDHNKHFETSQENKNIHNHEKNTQDTHKSSDTANEILKNVNSENLDTRSYGAKEHVLAEEVTYEHKSHEQPQTDGVPLKQQQRHQVDTEQDDSNAEQQLKNKVDADQNQQHFNDKDSLASSKDHGKFEKEESRTNHKIDIASDEHHGGETQQEEGSEYLKDNTGKQNIEEVQVDIDSPSDIDYQISNDDIAHSHEESLRVIHEHASDEESEAKSEKTNMFENKIVQNIDLVEDYPKKEKKYSEKKQVVTEMEEENRNLKDDKHAEFEQQENRQSLPETPDDVKIIDTFKQGMENLDEGETLQDVSPLQSLEDEYVVAGLEEERKEDNKLSENKDKVQEDVHLKYETEKDNEAQARKGEEQILVGQNTKNTEQYVQSEYREEPEIYEHLDSEVLEDNVAQVEDVGNMQEEGMVDINSENLKENRQAEYREEDLHSERESEVVQNNVAKEEKSTGDVVGDEVYEFVTEGEIEHESSYSPRTNGEVSHPSDDVPSASGHSSSTSGDTFTKETLEDTSQSKRLDEATYESDSTQTEDLDSDAATPLKDEEMKTDFGEELYKEAMTLLNNSKAKYDSRIFQLLKRAAYEHHHQKSQERLGRAYMFGDSVDQNFTKAFELFEMAANAGSPKAQQMMGFMYAAGIHVNSSQSRALVYLTFSALGGDTMAEMTLGYRYFAGITVAENCETALTYYRRVSSKVVADVSIIGGPAVQRIRLSEDVDQNSNNAMLDEDLIQYYQFLADKGDVQAQVGLGQLHFQGGRGVEQDFARAHRYFQMAADAGNANAYAFLGKLYSSGSDAVKANNETALKFFKKAAEMGNPVGQSGVGLMYLLGKGVPKDYAQAIKYFKLAADQGWVDGQLQLGTMYYHGLGLRRDYKQAIKFFNLASQSGNIQAIYYLGTMYSSGTGIVRSCRTATELFKNVAERGRWSSMLMDAHRDYKSGHTDLALAKYAYLGELGFETAQSNVAFILDQGLSSLMSDNYTYPRALLYWTRAAEQGNVGARVKVGDYHYYGQGTKVNYETAAFHYTVAQEQHRSAQAMFNLGYMHEKGLGMKQDKHLAKRFYDMAAEASPDAQAPVTLALMKLAVTYGVDWIKNNYNFWSIIHFNMDEKFGKDWDIYAMTVLALLVGLLILLRWR